MLWTTQDIRKLKEYYKQRIPPKEIGLLLGRTRRAIINKAHVSKISNNLSYTPEEKEKIIALYTSVPKDGALDLIKLCKEINRPLGNICRFAREKGLTNIHRKRPLNPENYSRKRFVVCNRFIWSEENISFLKKNYKDKTYKYLKQYIGVGDNIIRKKLKELGLNKLDGTTIWVYCKHPKGMTGKTHSKKYCKEFAERTRNYFKNATKEQLETRRLNSMRTKIKNGTLNPLKNTTNPYSRTHGGKRKDLNNIYFRSSWEANIARYYNFVGIKWEFEPKEFIFNTIKRGCILYTPDFYLPEEDRWVEVKGWMDKKSKTKLRRFEKYYPEEYAKLEIIDEKAYNKFKEYAEIIPGWEK